MVQTVDVEADRSGREDAPILANVATLLAEDMEEEILAVEDVAREVTEWDCVATHNDLVLYAAHILRRCAKALLSDGAPTRQDETEPTNGMNQESIPSPSQEEG